MFGVVVLATFSKIMRIVLTFDVEVWCNGWENLDQEFPSAFERYVYGRSPAGSFALPETLRVLHKTGFARYFLWSRCLQPGLALNTSAKSLR